jgi:uncharacterized protein YgbK (DUF1537 family)
MLIIADDLTGANDTAVQFVKHGFSALVITSPQLPESFDHAAYDVLSFNTDTRETDERTARSTVRGLIRRLKAAKVEGPYYKKIDSVLRGNPGSELSAVMDELAIPFAIVAPSFPANRSTLEHGMLRSGAQNTIIDAVKAFSGTMDKKAESVPLEKIRLGEQAAAEYLLSRGSDGVRVFIADAVVDEDLATIYRLSSVLAEPHVLAGSAGLANQIAGRLARSNGRKNGRQEAAPTGGPALVIAGTRKGETAAQIAALANAFSTPVIYFKTGLAGGGRKEEATTQAYDEAADQMKNNARLCIVAADSMFEPEIPASDAKQISSSMGALAGALMESFNFSVIVSTGGDISLEVCKRLGITGIQPLVEICPGIPMGRIVGGNFENRHIVTKSGRFGNKDALVEIVEYLERKR